VKGKTIHDTVMHYDSSEGWNLHSL